MRIIFIKACIPEGIKTVWLLSIKGWWIETFPIFRTLRYVPEESKDKVISDEDVLGALLKVFQSLFINDLNKQSDILTMLPEPVKSKYQDLLSVQRPKVELLEYRHQQQNIFKPEEILYKTLGFSVARATSSLISAGRGVFITKGLVPKGTVVSMYPGNGIISSLPIFLIYR